MEFDIHDFQWTREPASFSVIDGKVEIVTNPIPTCGSGPIIISAMTMPRCFRWKPRSSFSASP